MGMTAKQLKGFSDPYSFKRPNGTKDTLFFSSEVVGVFKMRNNLVLPIWDSAPVFDLDTIADYSAHKSKYYSSTEVNGHIESIRNPMIVGKNLVDGMTSLVKPDFASAFDLTEDNATVGLVKTLVHDALVALSAGGQSTGVTAVSPNSTLCVYVYNKIMAWLDPDGRGVPYVGPNSYPNNWYKVHNGSIGAARINYSVNSTNNPSAGVVITPPWFVRDLVGLQVQTTYTDSDSSLDANGMCSIPFMDVCVYVRSATGLKTHRFTVTRYWQGPKPGSYYYIKDARWGYFKVGNVGSYDFYAGNLDAYIYQSLAGKPYDANDAPKGVTTYNGLGHPFRSAILGYTPWPSPAVVAMSGLPQITTDGFVDASEANLSGIVDIHRIAAGYIDMAAYAPTAESRKAMSEVGEGMYRTEQYRAVLAVPGRGIATRGPLAGTRIVDAADGDVDAVKPAVVGSKRPDNEPGDLTLGVLDDINKQDMVDLPFMWGISFPLSPRTLNTYGATSLYWLASADGLSFTPMDAATGLEATVEEFEEAFSASKYPDVILNEAFTTLVSASQLSLVEYLFTNHEEVARLSSYNYSKDSKVGGGVAYEAQPWHQEFYFRDHGPGLDASKIIDYPEAKLLMSALKSHDISKVAAIHLGGIVGWATLPATKS